MLEVRDLSRRYGDVVALDGLSFEVPPGQMFGFLGPNGAGKTTTMRIILGVARPDRGGVRWRGRPIDAEQRLRFGYMPEERGLYPKMRLRDQIVYLARLHHLGKADAEAAADRWLEVLGIAARRKDPVEALSHGNQQRAQLAAALVHDPELLVLDEPFSGLDPVGIDALAGVLEERARAGVTVLFSSHQLDLVEDLCDAVAIIDNGRLVVSGRVRELKAAGRGRRLVVRVGGAPGAWASSLHGAEVEEERDGLVRLVLGGGSDPQAILAAAQHAGPVEHFSFEEPKLSEIFREAVSR